jgi:hypothetical protein
MIPGPDQIVACPTCGGLGRYATLLPGNNVGARVWTDLREIAPMLPRPPAVVRCRHCGPYYWLADAREVGELGGEAREDRQELWAGLRSLFAGGRTAEPPRFTREQIEHVRKPSEAEYYAALGAGLATNPAQEKTLRILTWWRRNDAYRTSPPGMPSAAELPASARENLEALVDLLSEEEACDRLMKAELLRELGRFEEARRVRHGPFTPGQQRAAEQLLSLCERGDTTVRELTLYT